MNIFSLLLEYFFNAFHEYEFADGVDDVEERISIIQERLCELKKTYMALKAEVALIDRKRKRIRRREAG